MNAPTLYVAHDTLARIAGRHHTKRVRIAANDCAANLADIRAQLRADRSGEDWTIHFTN